MCGIAGFTGPADSPTLRRMVAAQRHRGPDGHGFETLAVGGREIVHFGHRRLVVLDPVGGHQPMRTADGNTAITFNGEIYNFQHLRQQLESAGRVFRTRSDTEVLLQSLATWGEEALPLLDGMFAFAALDAPRSRLVLAVDRFGQKPLAWFLTPRRQLVFASELTALRCHPEFPGRLAALPLCRMLAFGQTPGADTIWRDVHRLEPATAMVVTLDADGAAQEWRTFRYWRVEDALRGPRLRLDEAELVDLLRRCVADQLVADVPVGVFLSGGIDSTVIAALAAAQRRIVTVTMGSEERDYDEAALARQTAARLGSEHHELRMAGSSASSILDAVVRQLDEPLADAGCLPAWELYRQARGLVTVAVGGDGGDELVEGYPTFGAMQLTELLRPLSGLAPVLVWLAERLPPNDGYYPLGFQIRRFAAGLQASAPFRLVSYIGCCPPALLRRLLRPELMSQAGLDPHAPDFGDRLYEPALPPEIGQARLPTAELAVYSHLRTFLAESVLRKVDRMAMAHSLEVRAPMLGTAFAEACLGLPSALRRRGTRGKLPLRHWLAASEFAHILHRPKRGFAIPVASWLRGPLREQATDVLLATDSPLREWCRPELLSGLWHGHCDKRRDSRKELWALLTLGLWAWHHLGRAPVPEGAFEHATHQ